MQKRPDNTTDMKISYLFHDCFLLETDSCTILTDYYKGVPIDPRPMIDKDTASYLLVSHHHKDHFSTSVFSWWHQIPELRYIVSRDVASMSAYLMDKASHYKGGNRVDAGRVAVLGLHDEFVAPSLRVEAFGSTDTGNSYVIETEGKRVFFAGDLNAWTWRDESTPEEVAEALESYMDVLNDIRGRYDSFDAALFPVDPRMGKDAVEGGRIFCDMFKVKCFIPMHFELWSECPERRLYLQRVKDSGEEIVGTTGSIYVPMTDIGDSVVV